MSRKRRRRRNKIHPNTPLAIQPRFGEALERYLVGRIRSAPLKWEWVGVGIAATILGASLAAGYFQSSLLSSTASEAVAVAIASGDYATARYVYENTSPNTSVLGAQTDLEDILYPERRLSREIDATRQMIEIYPNSRDLFLTLSTLYTQLGDTDAASEYYERARVLDPNNEMFK